MDRGAWQGYGPWSCKESERTERPTLSISDTHINSIYAKIPPLKWLSPPSFIAFQVNNFLCSFLAYYLLIFYSVPPLSHPPTGAIVPSSLDYVRSPHPQPGTSLPPLFSSLSWSTDHAPGLIFQTWFSSNSLLPPREMINACTSYMRPFTFYFSLTVLGLSFMVLQDLLRIQLHSSHVTT